MQSSTETAGKDKLKKFWGKAQYWTKYVVSGAVGAALFGFALKWIEARNQAVVTRIDDQIFKLYQPFYSASRENDMAWCVFVEGTWRASTDERPRCDDPTKAYWDEPTMPESDVERWRSRMVSVFQPANKNMLDLIQNNRSQLINGEEPPLWQVFMKHTFAYQGLIADWRPDDFMNRRAQFINVRFNVSMPPYPDRLSMCSRKIVELLREESQRIKRNPFIIDDPQIAYPLECSISPQRLGPP